MRYEMVTDRRCPICTGKLILVYYDYEQYERIECETCCYMEEKEE
jgi:Zn ribbon nucleic-acid-binding protein